jgi:hypothetical protein
MQVRFTATDVAILWAQGVALQELLLELSQLPEPLAQSCGTWEPSAPAPHRHPELP